MTKEEKRGRNGAGISTFPRRLWPVLVLVGTIAVFFNKMAFSNLILARGDTFVYFYPYWQAAAEALGQGRIPLWNSDLFMGAPFLANSQAGTFYPLNWPLWLLLPTPYAVSASIILHLLFASSGTYLAGRRCLALSRSGAVVGAMLFALGGYLTGQIEHVNQLQGLAWLPWYFVVTYAWLSDPRSREALIRTTLALGLLIALQLLAGHFQSVFISLFGVLIWLIASFAVRATSSGEDLEPRFGRAKELAARSLPFVLGGILALLIASIQLAPALELTALSSRQGGLPANEVLSFSLHPLLLARSLLPTYGQSLFSEYVALLPLGAILLALLGGWQWRVRPGVVPLAAIAVAGILLAFGVFNPGYHLLARLPLFNLFRAPARWLVLYALGMALLAGVGWDVITIQHRGTANDHHENWIRKPLLLGAAVLIALMLWGVLSVPLAQFIPTGAEAPVEAPSLWTWIGWVAELTVAYALLRTLAGRVAINIPLSLALIAVLLLVLFLGTRTLPYNNLTTPGAYFDLRPPVARLQALAACDETAGCDDPPGRLLSLSGILFDVGDQRELDAIYGDQLSERALYDNTVAVKQQEVLEPNLPMVFDLPSVDGFDGGILPLRNFTKLTRLILPEGEETTDGRLRENLDAVPDGRWLDLFNARYLVTDKVADAWREGVFFDLQHPVRLLPGGEANSVGYLPAFEADQLWLVAGGSPGMVEVATAAGDAWRLVPDQIEGDLFRIRYPEPAVAQGITLVPCESASDSDRGCMEPWRVEGLTLVDGRDEAFQPLVVGQYRLVYSGDVKIYENLDVLPRAFLVYDWEYRQEESDALEAMLLDTFDPSRAAVLVGEGSAPPPRSGQGSVDFQVYGAEESTLNAETDLAAFLILTDAHYPGWTATIDSEPSEIFLADGNFRAVYVPAGEHDVTFSYQPASFRLGAALSILGLLLLLVLAGAFLRSRLRRKQS